MTKPSAATTATESRITRRELLQATAGLTFGFVVGTSRDTHALEQTTDEALVPNAWASITVDGTITIFTPADEMGQGSMTALPIIFAEELDAEWSDVRIKFSPSDDEIYGNPRYHGLLTTQASATVTGYYDALRRCGAQARRVLLDSVAARWDVPLEELATEPSVVVHQRSGRRVSYGDVAAFTKMPTKLPQITERDLKDPAEFRLIGVDLPRRDLPSKTDGSAQYSIDVRLPGMVYATVRRPPVRGATPMRVDEREARAVPNVLDIVRLPYGIGVVSSTYEGALAAEQKLEVEWSEVEGSSFDSEEELEAQMRVAHDRTRRGRDRRSDQESSAQQRQKEVDAALDGAAGLYQAEYRTDLLYQAQMEPLNSVAWVKEGGKSVEIWAGTQAATHLVRAAAQTLDIPVESVNLHRMFLGGGFGRRCDMDHNWAIDSVLLSRAVGKPVKTIWSREHDVQFGRFKPISAHWLRCGVDDRDHIVAWHHRVVAEDVVSRADPYLSRAARDGWPTRATRDRPQFRYNFNHQRTEHVRNPIPARISWMRGVSTSQNEFANESFLDEVALARGVDPVEFRLRLLPASRPQTVLRTAADMADWGSSSKRGLGVAYTTSMGTIMATIAEVTVDHANGVIKVSNLWVAIDAGIAVQPLNVVGQIEGAVIYALSNALNERISIKRGRVEQSNFHNYPVLRLADVPEIHVQIVGTDRPPTGVGDRAVLGVAPSVANAFASLTGRRLRHMPMNPQRVLEALA